MFSKLEKWLGGVSTYYENLMRSRKELVSFNDADVRAVSERLKDISIAASYGTPVLQEIPQEIENEHPLDPKLQPLPLIAEFTCGNHLCKFYAQPEKAVKNDKYHALILNSDSNGSSPDSEKFLTAPSLPIWEELVHRNKDLNDLIKTKAPNAPWSLYKKAKNKVATSPEYSLQVGGYPQWLINDMDFRKIKKLEFLFEFKLSENCSVFYFYDPDLKESVFFKQKL
ncbi:hypothetical protein BST97_02110 [Nonlabens spongiae]|uniref:Uncharacterized protein n=1 Tax=Nonlabens spongiae TaxID=331648 RepID=A0A1W6MH03_9FLAO|nr:hypothetical protein [Nonlabens spongiae]ARN76891.1 hypothetical protein BST97_02110 [Nonlabens spongiae]